MLPRAAGHKTVFGVMMLRALSVSPSTVENGAIMPVIRPVRLCHTPHVVRCSASSVSN